MLFRSPSQKIGLLAAMSLRTMLDIHIPKILTQALNYLERTRGELVRYGNLDFVEDLDKQIDMYQDWLQSIERRRGNYLPHQFPIEHYKTLWMEEHIQAIVNDINRTIIYHKRNQTGTKFSRMDPVEDAKEIQKMALKATLNQWEVVARGWNHGYIIPNFLPRHVENSDQYTKTDPTIFYNYAVRFIEGIRKNSLLADWKLYQANARMAGERRAVMEETRSWYAAQIGDKLLYSKTIPWHKVKRGHSITFARDAWMISPSQELPSLGRARISGIVQKITADQVHLAVDKNYILWRARQDLKRWDDIINSMLSRGVDMNTPATHRQWLTIRNFLLKHYINQSDLEGLNLKKLTALDAVNLIWKGTKYLLAHPESIGVYDRKDVYGTDVKNKAVPNSVQLYTGAGSIEKLEATRDRFHNLELLGTDYDSAMPSAIYKTLKVAATAANVTVGAVKHAAGLFYMGMGAMFKARVVNQMGAIINNIIDAPIYNYFGGTAIFKNPVFRMLGIGSGTSAWHEGRKIWSTISHGQVEQMDPADAQLYKTAVGLGLTENNGILAIALEAANLEPEDLLIEQAGPDVVRWLGLLFRDATKYNNTYKKLKILTEEYYVADPKRQLEIKAGVNVLKLKWAARMHDILSKDEVANDLTDEQEKNNKA